MRQINVDISHCPNMIVFLSRSNVNKIIHFHFTQLNAKENTTHFSEIRSGNFLSEIRSDNF